MTVADDALYDAHAHVFTDDVVRYPVDTRGAREGEENLRKRIAANPVTAERLLQWWAESGVIGGAAVQYNTTYRTDNSYMLDSVDAYPDKYSAVVILDAAHPDTPAKLERLVVERGIVGLRLYGPPDANGGFPWFDSDAALRTWRVADRYGISMVIMYVPAERASVALKSITRLARQFPRLRIALDHIGWPSSDKERLGFFPALEAMSEERNVHFKISSINFGQLDEAGIDAASFVRRAADLMGADRIMWGSDVGNTLETYAAMAARAREAAAQLDPEERRLFLCDTARSLFARGAA